MALLRACVALRRDQSRPDSGLVQNCPALSTADSALTRPNGFLTGKLPPADR
jgi:hypothetical protein